MAITFAGGTGVSTTGAARGTTSTTVAYNNVAAGRMAILTVGAKPSSGTVATPSGWSLIGSATGGTGSNAADAGPTVVYGFYKILDGTETGSVTVNGTSTGSIQGVMDVYPKTLGNWDVPIMVSGNDSTHSTNISATTGTWADGINTGDWIHVGHSGDTDDSTTATSAPTITQSGSTIGTVAGRSQIRNTSGNQGMTYTWSAPVTTANSNTAAVTAGFTWSVSSCGPVIAIRLREYDTLSALTETFSAAFDSTKWAVNGAITSSGGVGTFDLTANVQLQTVRNYKVVNSAVLFQTVTYPDLSNNFYAGFRIAPMGNSTDFYGIYYNNTILSLERSTGAAVTIPLDLTAHKWLRLRDDGTNIYLETSPTGSVWTTRRTLTSGAGEIPSWRSSTGLQVSFEGGQGGTWVIDDVNNAPSTTPVSGTLDLRWAVQNTVTGSTDLRWAVQNTITGTMDLRWAVRAAIAGSIDLRWAVLAAISGTMDLRWAVRSVVASNLDLQWAVRSQVNGAVDLRWAVLSAISSTLDLRWAVRNQVNGTVDLRWAVLNALTGGIDLRWAVLNGVAGTLDLPWAVRNAVSGSTDLRWAVRNAVSGAIDLPWAVRSTVAGTLDLRWAVRQLVAGDLDLQWIVNSTVSQVSGTLDLQWAVRNAVSGSIDLPWAVRSTVAGAVDLRWAVLAPVGGSLDLRWKQLASVGGELDLRWATAGRVSGSLDLQWAVRNAVSGTLTLPWAVRGQISGALDLRWQVRARLVGAMQLLWVVEGVEATLPPAGNVQTQLTDGAKSYYVEHVRSKLTDRVTAYFPERIDNATEHVPAYLGLWP